MWGMLAVWIPLAHFFPALDSCDWLILIPVILVLAILFLHILACFYSVFLEPDKITVRWFGITVRAIPTAKLQLFCAVGNEREDVLCLTCRGVDEMAQLQEQRLLRHALTKHEVPFRKGKADWQDAFARAYLNHLRKNPFGIFKEKGTVMLQMQPALQYLIQHMYPQLPYKNYTGVTACYAARFSDIKEDRAICIPMALWDYRIDLKPDGIHICTKKEEVSFISAQQIKTAVRVDIFKGYEKHYPHHLPLMVISCLTEGALAWQADEWEYGENSMRLPNRQALLAMITATEQALRWTVKKKDYCVMHYTEKNLQTIRTLYPAVCVNDIAANWIYDTDAIPVQQH